MEKRSEKRYVVSFYRFELRGYVTQNNMAEHCEVSTTTRGSVAEFAIFSNNC